MQLKTKRCFIPKQNEELPTSLIEYLSTSYYDILLTKTIITKAAESLCHALRTGEVPTSKK